MIRALLTLLIFIVIFGVTTYVYYFHHNLLARLVLELGWLAVPILSLGIFLLAVVASKLTGLPLFGKRKVRSIVVGEVRPPLDIKMLVLGMVVGLLIMVPMIVVFVWLFRTIL